MRPYATFDGRRGLPEQFPDVGDLLQDARPTRCGHTARTAAARAARRRRLNKATRRAARAAIAAYLD